MEPTAIIVGIPKEGNNKKYDRLPFGLIDDKCDAKLCQFNAGYDDHSSGPESLVGIRIKTTWNDAIDLDKYAKKIAKVRQIVKQKTGKEPKLWVIGHQT